MPMKDHFQMFAAYNHWANEVIYSAAATLTPAEFNDNKGAFFGSLMATLNHLLCADRIWMSRFTGTGDAPKALNTILFADISDLRPARDAEDQRISDWIDGLDETVLAQNFSYIPVSTPEPVTQKLGSALSHFFNHQTHHRGQCHMILTSLGKPSVTLDMVAFQRSAGRQWL
jgi:uncharacterized damage-inducible protein DinB